MKGSSADAAPVRGGAEPDAVTEEETVKTIAEDESPEWPSALQARSAPYIHCLAPCGRFCAFCPGHPRPGA